jgi:hypothetical protein
MKKNYVFAILALLFLLNGSCSEKVVVLPKPDFADLLVKASPFKGFRQEQGAQDNKDVIIEILPESKKSVIFKDGNIQFSVTILDTDYETALLQVNQQVSSAGNIVGRPFDAKLPNQHGIFYAKDSKGATINNMELYVNAGAKVWSYILSK